VDLKKPVVGGRFFYGCCLVSGKNLRWGVGAGSGCVLPFRDTLQVRPCTLASAIPGLGRSRKGKTHPLPESPCQARRYFFSSLEFGTQSGAFGVVLAHGTVCGRDAAREPTGMYSRRVP